jgi:hypothetical protein
MRHGAFGDQCGGQITVGQQVLGQRPGDCVGDDGGGRIGQRRGTHWGAT